MRTRRQEYKRRKAAGKPARPANIRTFNTILGTLRLILADAQVRELISTNPVDIWKAQKGKRRGTGIQPVDPSKVLTADELGTLLEVASQHFPDHFPIVLFMADTGCRISEAFAVRWIDVDLAGGTVKIQASIDSTGNRKETKTGVARTVELSTRLRQVLESVRPDVFGDSALLFPNSLEKPLEYQNFKSRVFNKLVRKAFGRDRRVTPHMLRHTFASPCIWRAVRTSCGFRTPVDGRTRRCCSMSMGTSCRRRRTASPTH